MKEPKQDQPGYSQAGKYLPQEEMLEVKKHKNHLTIGIPREITYHENRIALVPAAVNLLIQNGHKVLIESKAGDNAYFFDESYKEAGGEIVYDKKEVYKSDIILKVAPPNGEELKLLRPGHVLFSTLALTMQNENFIKTLISKKVNAIAFELIKDRANALSIVRSMSEIAGNTSILIASEYLSDRQFGKGQMFGGFSGITPTEVVILGAGTVGEFAVRAANGLGAFVKIFDNSIYRLRRLQSNLNMRIFTSIIQPKVLLKALKTADVVICAIHSPEGRSPVVITEDMVSQMKHDSVIVDVSIDQGGCVETSRVTTHADPVFKKYNVTHYCVPNIASRVPHTASYALSNFFAPVLLNIGEGGGVENLLKIDAGIRHGVYVYNGILCNSFIGEYFSIPYQDIDLLMAAWS